MMTIPFGARAHTEEQASRSSKAMAAFSGATKTFTPHIRIQQKLERAQARPEVLVNIPALI
jgi:hypothetical protein